MLYYCKNPAGNFGDDLNPWLWPRLAPEVCDEKDPTLFIGIGTILSHKLPPEPVKVVFGAGCGYRRPPKPDHTWHVYCVRGPLTATRLGLDPALALTDSALLVRRVPVPTRNRIHEVSFMPHHQSMFQADWDALCCRAGLHCIDSRKSVDEVLPEIQSSELLITEAMHGAIVADALRVPWIPIRIYSPFLLFKWRDWTESIQVPLNLVDVPPVFEKDLPWGDVLAHTCKKALARTGLGKDKWNRLQVRTSSARDIDLTLQALQRLARSGIPCLSTDETTRLLEERLLSKLSDLRRAWPQGRFAGAG